MTHAELGELEVDISRCSDRMRMQVVAAIVVVMVMRGNVVWLVW